MLEIFHTSFLLLFHTRFGSIQSDGSNASSAELLLADVNWFDPSVRTIENTQSASPLCLPNNYHWNALAGRTTKTSDQRSSLRVVEEGLEQLRRVKGKLWSATILILRSYLILADQNVVHTKKLLTQNGKIFISWPKMKTMRNLSSGLIWIKLELLQLIRPNNKENLQVIIAKCILHLNQSLC